uniref:Uncharacterized protein n=1 Tax=Timema cristinae TaxID=61476 RepID=A0A7R9D0V1_TIMCR|nr:unnamed protein product [Timema cristinae]
MKISGRFNLDLRVERASEEPFWIKPPSVPPTVIEPRSLRRRLLRNTLVHAATETETCRKKTTGLLEDSSCGAGGKIRRLVIRRQPGS